MLKIQNKKPVAVSIKNYKFKAQFLLLVIFLCALYQKLPAQVTIPFSFTSEDDNRLLRETDSLKYYVATGDTLNTVCLNEEASYYWLYNKNFKLIVDGAYILEGEKYLPDGKWTEHYENGKVKLTGYYKRNKPIGTWQEFYQNGKLMDVYNYAILLDNGDITSCLSGSYQEYYQNGKLKINGFYSAAMVDETDTQVITDPVTGLEKTAITHHSEFKNAKVGPWEYYKETGELDRKVDY